MPFEITQVFTYYAQIYASYAYIVSPIVINTSPSKMKLAFSSGVRYLGGGGGGGGGQIFFSDIYVYA